MEEDNRIEPELPLLEVGLKRMVADMETEHIHFVCRGRTMEEAKDGFRFLMESQERIKHNDYNVKQKVL